MAITESDRYSKDPYTAVDEGTFNGLGGKPIVAFRFEQWWTENRNYCKNLDEKIGVKAAIEAAFYGGRSDAFKFK